MSAEGIMAREDVLNGIALFQNWLLSQPGETITKEDIRATARETWRDYQKNPERRVAALLTF